MIALGQLGRFELGSSRALYFHDVALAVGALVFLVDRFSVLKEKMRSSLLGKVFIALNLWILATSLLHFSSDQTQFLSVGLYLVRFDVMCTFGVLLSDLRSRKILHQYELKWWLVSVLSSIAILGLIQYGIYPDTRDFKLLGWDDHYYRLISTLFDPGFTGILLTIGAIVSLGFVIATQRSSWKSIVGVATFCISFVALLLTYSRASYLAFLIALVFFALRTKKYLTLVLLPLFVMCIFLLPRPGGEGVKLERTASVVARIDSVNDSFSEFSFSNVLIGKGWYWKKQVQPTSIVGDQTVPNHSSAPENSFVFVFSSLGIIGLLLCGSIVFLLLQRSAFSVEVTTIMLAVSVHALFTNTFFYPFILIVLAVVMVKNEPKSLE